MNTRDEILRMIANTMIMYAYHIQENGLLNGKTGVMLYLYMYAQHSGDEICYNFAGELLDGLMKSSTNAPSSFEDGAAGLGWAVGWLIRHDIIGGNPNSVLGNVDHQIIDSMSHDKWSETWNELLYFAYRVTDRPEDGNGRIKMILSYIAWHMKTKKDLLSFERRCAVGRFLSTIKQVDEGTHEIAALCEQIESGLHMCMSAVCAQPVNNLDCKISSIRNDIHLSIWNWIFCNQMPAFKHDMHEIQNFVERQQEGLTPDELTLSFGLAGLGIPLLASIYIN